MDSEIVACINVSVWITACMIIVSICNQEILVNEFYSDPFSVMLILHTHIYIYVYKCPYVYNSPLQKAEETVLGRMKIIPQTFIFTTRWGNLPKVLEAVYLNDSIQQFWLQRRLHMPSCCEYTFCQHRYLRAQGRVFRLNFQTQANGFLNNLQPQVLLVKKSAKPVS